MMKYVNQPGVLGLSALAFLLSIAAPAAIANAGTAGPGRKADASVSSEKHASGRQGDQQKVTRTITVDMNDRMRFIPGDIKVRQGETIRFVVRNRGKIRHEMVIGTMAELQSHQEMMRQHPGMEHEEAYMTHVDAGRRGEMIWQFTEAGEFHYACLVPGHFEAGMIGKITVTKG